MAKKIIADQTTDDVGTFMAEAAEEEAQARHGFDSFSWLSKEAEARHGPSMTEAFNLSRSFLHGNAALLELIEDEGLVPRDRTLGTSRTGDVMRFLVTANTLVAARLADLQDKIDEEVSVATAAMVDFDTRR